MKKSRYKKLKSKQLIKIQNISKSKKEKTIEYALNCIKSVPSWITHSVDLCEHYNTIRAICLSLIYNEGKRFVFFSDIAKYLGISKKRTINGNLSSIEFAGLSIACAESFGVVDYKIDFNKLLYPCSNCGEIPQFGIIKKSKNKSLKGITCRCGNSLFINKSMKGWKSYISGAKKWKSINENIIIKNSKKNIAKLNEFNFNNDKPAPPDKWVTLASSIPVDVTAALVSSKSWEAE